MVLLRRKAQLPSILALVDGLTQEMTEMSLCDSGQVLHVALPGRSWMVCMDEALLHRCQVPVT